jgi:hypothetical protein
VALRSPPAVVNLLAGGEQQPLPVMDPPPPPSRRLLQLAPASIRRRRHPPVVIRIRRVELVLRTHRTAAIRSVRAPPPVAELAVLPSQQPPPCGSARCRAAGCLSAARRGHPPPSLRLSPSAAPSTGLQVYPRSPVFLSYPGRPHACLQAAAGFSGLQAATGRPSAACVLHVVVISTAYLHRSIAALFCLICWLVLFPAGWAASRGLLVQLTYTSVLCCS